MKTQPVNIRLNGADVLILFLLGIGVVKTQIAAPAKLAGQAEIETDGLGMTDMQVTVGLGGKAGYHGLDHTLIEVFGNDLLDKILWLGVFH